MDHARRSLRLTLAWSEGRQLSSAAGLRLPKRVSAIDDDGWLLRARLIGFAERPDAPKRFKSRRAFWVLELLREVPLLSSGVVHLDPDRDRDLLVRATRVWRAHVARAPGDVRVLDAAAAFHRRYDLRASERLWQKARRLEPNEPRWAAHLASLDMERADRASPSHSRRWAKRALETLETSLPAAKRGCNDWLALASAALGAGELARAGRAARRALRAGAQGRKLNAAHTVLGQVALHRGGVRAAVEHLGQSLQVTSDPELAYFGPSFVLAGALARRGHWEAVARYVAEAGGVWARPALARWAAEIETRRVPDFDGAGWGP